VTAEIGQEVDERAPLENDRGGGANDGGSDQSAKSERGKVDGKAGDRKWGKDDFSLPPPAIPSGFGAEERKQSESPRGGGAADHARAAAEGGAGNAIALAKSSIEASPGAAAGAETGTGSPEHGAVPAKRRHNQVERPDLDGGTPRRSKRRSAMEAPAEGRRKKR
jgi:hypothetical protein